MDAVDAAFATIYGKAAMTQFQVWSCGVHHSGAEAGEAAKLGKSGAGPAALGATA
jgi:hypothetical protein